MSKHQQSLSVFLFLAMILSVSCAKEDKVKGCMEITAINFDPLAEESGPCSYENTDLIVFANGQYGVWNSNAFIFLPCAGSFDIVDLPSGDMGMALVGDSVGKFFGFFQTLNVNDGRYYATPNSTLNFDAQLTQPGVEDSVHVFIRGQEPETVANCIDILTSERQLLSTSSLADGVMQPVSFNLQNFEDLFLQNVGIVAGFEFQTTPFDTLMIINNVQWQNY